MLLNLVNAPFSIFNHDFHRYSIQIVFYNSDVFRSISGTIAENEALADISAQQRFDIHRHFCKSLNEYVLSPKNCARYCRVIGAYESS